MRKYLTALVASIIIVGAPALPVLAQTSTTGNGFRVSPVRQELTIEPGKSETVEITVENITNDNIVAHPVVNDFVASDQENGEPRLILDTDVAPPGNSFKTLVGKLPDVPLNPHERKVVKVTLNVPGNAAAGGYYGAVRFSPSSVDESKQVSLTASIGELFLVKVPGNILEKIDIASIGASLKGKVSTFFTKSPDATVVRLKNSGAIHLQPYGRIEVKDWHGRIISNEEFNNSDPRGNVLPNSIRKFTTPLNAKTGLGRYTIYANLGYSTSGQLISGQASFWVIPWWFVFALTAVVILVFGGVTFFRSRRAKRTRRHH